MILPEHNSLILPFDLSSPLDSESFIFDDEIILPDPDPLRETPSSGWTSLNTTATSFPTSQIPLVLTSSSDDNQSVEKVESEACPVSLDVFLYEQERQEREERLYPMDRTELIHSFIQVDSPQQSLAQSYRHHHQTHQTHQTRRYYNHQYQQQLTISDLPEQMDIDNFCLSSENEFSTTTFSLSLQLSSSSCSVDDQSPLGESFWSDGLGCYSSGRDNWLSRWEQSSEQGAVASYRQPTSYFHPVDDENDMGEVEENEEEEEEEEEERRKGDVNNVVVEGGDTGSFSSMKLPSDLFIEKRVYDDQEMSIHCHSSPSSSVIAPNPTSLSCSSALPALPALPAHCSSLSAYSSYSSPALSVTVNSEHHERSCVSRPEEEV